MKKTFMNVISPIEVVLYKWIYYKYVKTTYCFDGAKNYKQTSLYNYRSLSLYLSLYTPLTYNYLLWQEQVAYLDYQIIFL
jgi:hypothetical protein